MDDGHARTCTTPRATMGNETPNAETDGGYFISFRFVSFRRKIGGPTRRSAKGGWTPEEVRGLKFENLNAYDTDDARTTTHRPVRRCERGTRLTNACARFTRMNYFDAPSRFTTGKTGRRLVRRRRHPPRASIHGFLNICAVTPHPLCARVPFVCTD